MLRRPLVIPTLAFVTGIVLGKLCAPPLAPTIVGSGLLLLLHALLLTRPSGHHTAPWLHLTVWLTAASLGTLALRIDQSVDSPAALRHLTPADARLGSLRGTIDETPTLRVSERNGQLIANTSVRIRVSAWRPVHGDWQPASGFSLLNVRGPLPIQASRESPLEAFGTLLAPEPPEAPGLFDYAAFLENQSIHRIFRVDSTNEIQLSPPPGGIPWSEQFLPWAHGVLARGVPDDESARLLRSMTLGWKTPLTGEVDDVFMRAGTMHVFAISGLHIALLMAMVLQLFRALRLPRLAAGALALPLTWAYVAATGWQASAIRSAVMASVVLAGASLNRPGDLLNSLAGAAAVILVNEPTQLYQSGFQLSFVAVAGLALLVRPLERCLLNWVPQDPWLPAALRPRWLSWLALPGRLLVGNLAVGIAALLASLPLTVHHFNLVSPVSLIANLVVVPLSSLALAAATASLAVAPITPAGSEIFNASGWLWMRGMIDLSRWFAAWPGGWWSVEAPAWYWWLGWYAALGLGWLRLTSPESRPRTFRTGCAGVTIWALAAGFRLWERAQTPRIFVFRNDPALILQSVTGTTLIDGGRAGSGRRLILPFLRAHGVNRLDHHIVSQGIQRFCGLGPELLPELPPHVVWVPNLTVTRQPILRRYQSQLTQRNIDIHTLGSDFTHPEWRALSWPSGPSATSHRSTDHAPVLRGEFAGVSVLWLGGISAQIVTELLTHPAQLKADVVISVAHAGTDPLPAALLSAAAPKLALVITAPSPAAARIEPGIRARLKQAECPVLLTDEAGAVQLEFRRGRFRWQSFGPVSNPPAASRSLRPSRPDAAPIVATPEDPLPAPDRPE